LSRSQQPDGTVQQILDLEKECGLFSEEEWKDFSSRSRKAIDGLREWLLDKEKLGKTVVGYGAAHKGNTFLNAVGEASRTLRYVVDASHEKQGRFLPGSQIPVLAPEQLNLESPSEVLILPWNIAEELSNKIKSLAPKARIWVAQPSMKEIKL
jgi:hypothetical protein